ncbi:hypothetical protein MKZ38_001800 [Zalerion maritima]|uniref:Uncharacterized protein n=1 Tax=Zalerion maritima TaxID=339359 RepID=A0AAD5RXF7_9PEZI|nr:hypothetical protein MKZ38_001800 [Zalerion maritima]
MSSTSSNIVPESPENTCNYTHLEHNWPFNLTESHPSSASAVDIASILLADWKTPSFPHPSAHSPQLYDPSSIRYKEENATRDNVENALRIGFELIKTAFWNGCLDDVVFKVENICSDDNLKDSTQTDLLGVTQDTARPVAVKLFIYARPPPPSSHSLASPSSPSPFLSSANKFTSLWDFSCHEHRFCRGEAAASDRGLLFTMIYAAIPFHLCRAINVDERQQEQQQWTHDEEDGSLLGGFSVDRGGVAVHGRKPVPYHGRRFVVLLGGGASSFRKADRERDNKDTGDGDGDAGMISSAEESGHVRSDLHAPPLYFWELFQRYLRDPGLLEMERNPRPSGGRRPGLRRHGSLHSWSDVSGTTSPEDSPCSSPTDGDTAAMSSCSWGADRDGLNSTAKSTPRELTDPEQEQRQNEGPYPLHLALDPDIPGNITNVGSGMVEAFLTSLQAFDDHVVERGRVNLNNFRKPFWVEQHPG